jgi:hypothetical protein
MLALIIQNKTRAGWFLVRSSSMRLMPELVKKERWATAGIIAAILIIFVAMMPGLLNGKKTDSSVKKPIIIKQLKPVQNNAGAVEKVAAVEPVKTEPVSAVKPDAIPVTAAIVPPPARQAAPEVSKTDFRIPESLGHLRIRRGGTIFYLLQEIYGGVETARFKALIKANPQIKDMNKVWAGETIHFPAIPVNDNPLSPEKTWVEIARKKSLDEAYQLFKDYPSDQPSIRLIPSWDKDGGLVFSVVLKNGFSGEAEAKNAIRKLTETSGYTADIMRNRGKDAVYFAN